jgi:hypothetical protein
MLFVEDTKGRSLGVAFDRRVGGIQGENYLKDVLSSDFYPRPARYVAGMLRSRPV